MRLSIVIIVASTLALTGCYSNPNYSPVKSHHTKQGFNNRYPHPAKGSIWKWQWERWRKGVPADPEDGYGRAQHHDRSALDAACFAVFQHRAKALHAAADVVR